MGGCPVGALMTKTLFVLLLAAPLAAVGADKPAASKSKPAATATKAAKAKARPDGLPAGAVETGPGTWKWTAPGGTVRTYKMTPFGVRAGDEPVRPARQASSAMTATEEGDIVRFSRDTPFGARTWTKKKDELDETERLVYERDCRKAEPASGENAAPPAAEKDQ